VASDCRNKVKFSVITPCLNRRETIAAAVESVLAQGYDNVEHIVIDGNSNDGTLDVLARYGHLRVISEPDQGLYDAINKGIAMSRGEVIGHLNSDDLYADGAFLPVVAAFARDPSIECVSGGVEVFEMTANGERVVAKINARKIKELREGDVVHGTPIINGRFFRRSLYERIGGYDLRFRLCADTDFLLRALAGGMRRTVVDGVVYRYRAHAGSLTMGSSSAEDMLRECLAAAESGVARSKPGSYEHNLYVRWRAWATGYLAGWSLKQGRVRESLGIALRGLNQDLRWPLAFATLAVDHWRTRQERRWSDD
jgi:hypothetical protein